MPTLHSSLTPLRLLPRLRSFHVGPDARRLVSSSSACSFPSSNLLPTSIWVGCLRRHRPPSVSSFTSSFSSSAKDSFSKLPMPPSYFWAHSHEDTPPLSVGVYQGPTVVGGLEAALQHMHDIASRAQAQGTQLLCFPEVCTPTHTLSSIRSTLAPHSCRTTSSSFTPPLTLLSAVLPRLRHSG